MQLPAGMGTLSHGFKSSVTPVRHAVCSEPKEIRTRKKIELRLGR